MITHKHHIIPRHAGGTDDPSNLVLLSIADHASAHLSLFGQFGRREDRLAWMSLSGMLSKEEIIYEACLIGAANGGRIGGQKGGSAGKGKKKPEGFGEKISLAVSGPKNGMYKTKLTPPQKEKQKASLRKVITDIGNENWIGTKNLTASNVSRIKDGSHPSQVIWTCEHCGKTSRGLGNYVRYHGDKCKARPIEQPSSC